MIDALVTGSNGFIGKALERRLDAEGLEKLCLTSQSGDVTEPSTWANLPPARVLYHLAAKTYVPKSWEEGSNFIKTNVLGTEQALAYCRKHGTRLVFLSTYVYGQPVRLPVAEDHPVVPNNPSALSKYMAEQLCTFASTYQGAQTTILRLFNVFGAGQREEFLIPVIVKQVQGGKEVRVKDLAPKRDYIYIEDVVGAMLKAGAANTNGEIYNIGSGASYSVQEIIDTVQKVAGTALPVFSDSEVRRQELSDVVADISKAKKELEWEPTYSFADGIAHMLKTGPRP